MREKRSRAGLRTAGALVVMFLLGLSLVGLTAASASGSDPEPVVPDNVEYSIAPGPGWPEGWTEPPVPTEIPQEAIDTFMEIRAMPIQNKPERQELRILSPMPEWTREYPYVWNYVLLRCGVTQYVYFYPKPDTKLIWDTTGVSYSVVGGGGGGVDCRFEPVVTIRRNEEATPEQLEQVRLEAIFFEHIVRSRGGRNSEGGLDECVETDMNGSYDSIQVCFNGGQASKRFDVSAYLDVDIGRVRVPLRFLSEQMGAFVHWDETSSTISIRFPEVTLEVVGPESIPGYTAADWWSTNRYSLDREAFKFTTKSVHQSETTIVLTVGSDVVLVNGVETRIDAPPVLRDGRAMVPVRFIAQTMGAKVYWVGSEPIWPHGDGTLGGRNQVHIFTPFHPLYENPSWFLDNYGMKF